MEVTRATAAEVVSDEEIAPAPRAKSVGGRLFRGTAVEVLGFGSAQIIRLGSNLVLTRLLFPEAFGVMAMLSLVQYSLFMLTDVGLAQAVVRSERGDDPAFLDTAWSLQVVRGFGLWVVASLLAWPFATFVGDHQLLYVIPVGSLSTFIYALGSTRPLTLRRELRPLPIGLNEIGSQLAGTLTMIGLAWAGLGIWSLVVGNLTNAVVHTVGTHFLPGTHRVRFRVEERSKQEIVHFGRWIFASSAFTVLAGRGDQFVLGRLLGTASVGIYNLALTLAEAPELVAGRVVSGLLYPLYARTHYETPDELPRVYYRTRLLLDSIVHTGLGALIPLAPWIIHLLYDRRYEAAFPMLQILAVRTSISMLATPCETALVAAGLSEYGFRRNLAVALATFTAMPVGHHLGGSVGLLWGTAVARGAALLVLWPMARRRGLLRLRRELLILPLLGIGYAIGTVLVWMLPNV